jgi:hypothetical protein
MKLRQRYLKEHEEAFNLRAKDEEQIEDTQDLMGNDQTEIDYYSETDKTEPNVPNIDENATRNKTDKELLSVPFTNKSEVKNSSGELRMGIELDMPMELEGKLPGNNENKRQNVVPVIHQNLTLRPMPSSISSSFLDHIYWPEESQEKKKSKRKTVRLPYATTSTRWLKFHEDKDNKKRTEEESKKQRVLELNVKKKTRKTKPRPLISDPRKQLKRKNQKTKKKEWNKSETSGEELSNEWDETIPEKDEFLVVAFPSKR